MMPKEENEGASTKVLSTDTKDCQLEIINDGSFSNEIKLESPEVQVLAEGSENSVDSEKSMKYVQVLDSNKGGMLDFLNLALVRSEDGQETYQFVTNSGSSDDNDMENTVTCILQSAEDGDAEQEETYLMVDSAEGPLVILQRAVPEMMQQVKTVSTSEQIPKAVMVPQKRKCEQYDVNEQSSATQAETSKLAGVSGAGAGAAAAGKGKTRRFANELPPPHEMLASPNFKLFLYSCKLCSFRCNAIKELTAHKAAEHGGGGGGARSRRSANVLQCARCPFRGGTHGQLMRHVQEKHSVAGAPKTVYLKNSDIEEADLLVCGACGFETPSHDHFKVHIQQDHRVAPVKRR